MNRNPGPKTSSLQLGSLPALSQIKRIKHFSNKFSRASVVLISAWSFLPSCSSRSPDHRTHLLIPSPALLTLPITQATAGTCHVALVHPPVGQPQTRSSLGLAPPSWGGGAEAQVGLEREEEQAMVSGLGTFTYSGAISSNDFSKLSRGYRLLQRAAFSHFVPNDGES